MTCRELVDLVTDYFDGALDRPAREALEAHLRDCHGCSAYVEQMRIVIRSIGELPAEPPDPAAREALLRAFRQRRR